MANGVLRKGDKSALVREVHGYLITLGFKLGPTGADGDFGNYTYGAVLAFQQLNRLPATGVVDSSTLTLMKSQASAGAKVSPAIAAQAEQVGGSAVANTPPSPFNWKMAVAIGGGLLAVGLFWELLKASGSRGTHPARAPIRTIQGTATITKKCRYGPPAASELEEAELL